MAEVKKGFFVDLLDGSFRVMGRTWQTSLLLGAVVFFPPSWFFGWAYGRFFDVLLALARGQGDDLPTALLVRIGFAYLWILLAAIAQGLVTLFVRACVTSHAALVVRGVPSTPFTVIPEVARFRFPRLLGQRVLQGVILGITLTIGMTLTTAAIAGFSALHLTALAVVLGILLGIGTIGAYAWALIRFSLTLESLVIDNAGIEQSLDQSAFLVRGDFWRVLGSILLFGIMVSFASSLIVTPIIFFAGIRAYGDFLRTVATDSDADFNAVLLGLLAGMGRKLGLMAYLQSLLAGFVTPAFMTLMFFALKKRREPAPEETLP